MQIGNRIRQIREKENISRDALAEKLNISTLFLGYIECGQKGMSLTTLQNLCRELNVSADYILLGIESPDISRKNIHLLLEKVDDKYIPLIEVHLKNTLYTIKKVEEMYSSQAGNSSK